MKIVSEKKLVFEAKNSPKAFTKLYKRYVQKTYFFVRSKVNTTEVAEDLCSEIWFKILHNIKDFTPKKNYHVPAWIFRIARNHIIDFYRTHKEINVGETFFAFVADENDAHESVFDQHINKRFLFEEIKKLPPKEQEIIMLKYFSNLKNKEIAEILKIGEKTVSSSHSKALKKLRKKTPNYFLAVFF